MRGGSRRDGWGSDQEVRVGAEDLGHVQRRYEV